MNFWDWAQEVYARPGVAQTCLELQDSHRQSMPYLLWVLWAADSHRALPTEVVRSGALLAAQWEAAAVGPLRAARRGLKPPAEGVSDAVRQALRAEVQAVELKAEQALMNALEAMAPAPSGAAADRGERLAAAVDAWSFPAPAVALERLAQALV